MKLKQFLKQVPLSQNLVIARYGEKIATGISSDIQVTKFGEMTVGLIFSGDDLTLWVNVYKPKKGKKGFIRTIAKKSKVSKFCDSKFF